VQPLLLVPEGRALAPFPPLKSGSSLEVRRIAGLQTLEAIDPDRPTVLIVDAGLVAGAGGSAPFETLAARAALIGLGSLGEDEPSKELKGLPLSAWVPAGAATGVGRVALEGALRHAAALVSADRTSRLARNSATDLRELSRVGAALGTERDLDTLLTMILSQARRLASADAGSLYLVEKDESGNAHNLRFKLSQNHTLPQLPFSEFTIPIDHTSLSGYVAATGDPLMIGDVYQLPEHVSYRQNRSFDEKFGYRTKSMLVLPMRTLKDEVIGVVQLINRKRDAQVALTTERIVEEQVIPFDQRATDLVAGLAAQAAVAI
jgi:hypothetical protein